MLHKRGSITVTALCKQCFFPGLYAVKLLDAPQLTIAPSQVPAATNELQVCTLVTQDSRATAQQMCCKLNCTLILQGLLDKGSICLTLRGCRAAAAMSSAVIQQVFSMPHSAAALIQPLDPHQIWQLTGLLDMTY